MLSSSLAISLCINLILFMAFPTIFARIYSIENEDGSYSIGSSSDSRGETANSVLALLGKSSGWTDTLPTTPSQQDENHFSTSVQSKDLFNPHLQVLQLIETFLKLKGEIASRVHALINDNFDIISSVSKTMINKIGGLHSFTLTGIIVLRRILEFAAKLIGQWHVSLDVTKPAANFGFNYRY